MEQAIVARSILYGLWKQGLKDVEILPKLFESYKASLTTLFRYSPDMGDNQAPKGCLMFKDMRVWPLGRMPRNG